MKYNNQKVLITGGSSGIGLALAKKFIDNNNTVIITGRNFAKLEKVKAENPKIHFFQSDVTSDAEVRKLSDDIDQQFGGIDVLINNAGIMCFKVNLYLIVWCETKASKRLESIQSK